MTYPGGNNQKNNSNQVISGYRDFDILKTG